MGKIGSWSNQIQAVPTRRGEGGEAGVNNWSPIMVHMILFLSSIITCELYKLTLSNQAHVSPQLTVSHSEFEERFLAGLPLLQGPNPLSAALGIKTSHRIDLNTKSDEGLRKTYFTYIVWVLYKHESC